MQQSEFDHHPSQLPKWRCFGSNAAISVEGTPWLVKGEASGWTVTVDVAPIIDRKTLWDRKVQIQLSADELAVLAAVLLGFLPRCSAKRSNKGLYCERQDGKLFVRGSQQGENYALPIPIGATCHFSALVLRQFHKHCEGMDSDLMLAAIRGAAALYRPNETDKA